MLEFKKTDDEKKLEAEDNKALYKTNDRDYAQEMSKAGIIHIIKRSFFFSKKQVRVV